MAGEELQSALGGLAFSGMDNPYGIAASALGTATPGMISPYASTGQALGIGLGSILLQSLLGYQARQTALQDTLQANTLANQMLKLQTPEERTSFIGGLDESSAITGRLSNLSTALLQREVLQKNELDLIKKKRMAELGAAGEFYATPEGQAARQFEIDKIAEEAKARRTPLDEYLAREEARKTGLLELERLKQTGRVDIETLKQAGRTDLQNLKDAAASGRAQDKLAWQEKQNQIDADLKRELVGLGVEAAVEKKRRIDELTMANRAAGQDPDLALVNAKAEIAQELVGAREAASSRLIEKAREEREKEAAYKRTLELANPKAPAALVTENVRRISASNMAVEIADELDRYNNWITYRIGTAFSAIDEAALRSRLKKLSFEERKALSGTATTDKEKQDINEMLNGDFTAGPETKAMLLRRFANDSRRLAMDNMKGGFTPASDFIKSVEQAMQSGGRVEFATPSAGVSTGSATLVSPGQYMNQLKAKYGADWKTKITPEERAEAGRIVQQMRQ